jgi:DNA-3-methyladenine glycosylase
MRAPEQWRIGIIDHRKADDMQILPLKFFARSAEEVAPDLIGCYLFTTIDGKRTGGMIIETEAYDHNDPFCHCHKNADAFSKEQSKPMFFGPGHVYIYWVSSGQLPCLNFVCNQTNHGRSGATFLRVAFEC